MTPRPLLVVQTDAGGVLSIVTGSGSGFEDKPSLHGARARASWNGPGEMAPRRKAQTHLDVSTQTPVQSSPGGLAFSSSQRSMYIRETPSPGFFDSASLKASMALSHWP